MVARPANRQCLVAVTELAGLSLFFQQFFNGDGVVDFPVNLKLAESFQFKQANVVFSLVLFAADFFAQNLGFQRQWNCGPRGGEPGIRSGQHGGESEQQDDGNDLTPQHKRLPLRERRSPQSARYP